MPTGSRLSELRESLARYSARFDASLLTCDDAAVARDEAAAIEKMSATIKVLAAARAADSGQWRRNGARSAAHDLAQRSGTTVGAAAEALAAAHRLEKLPVLAGAARRGEVSPQQVAAIADAAEADPAAERRLVESAKSSSLGELRDTCARTKAAARPRQAEAEHDEVHRTRYLRTFRDRNGGWNLSLRNVPEVGAEVMAILRPLQDLACRRARAEGRRESLEAYGADAFTDMVRRAAGASSSGRLGGPAGGNVPGGGAAAGTAAGEREGTAGDPGPLPHLFAAGAERPAGSALRPGGEAGPGPGGGAEALATGGAVAPRPAGGAGAVRPVAPAKVIARIDWDALVRGFPIDGELCEIDGIGPVPVSVVRAMMGSGDAFLAAVVTKGVDVANVAHLGRRATAHQLTALQWRSPECPALGCNAKSHLEIDHVEDWATTKITLLSQLERPCSHHHDLKTRENWAFVEGVGKRPMVPPDDPRHPRHRARAGAGPDPEREPDPELGPGPSERPSLDHRARPPTVPGPGGHAGGPRAA